MGRGEPNLAAEKLDVLKQSRVFYEPQLIALGLGIQELERQTLEELEISLNTVNDAIKDPSAFGKLRFAFSVSTGRAIIRPSSADDSQFEVSILPLLLERRKLILERSKELRGDEEIAKLQDLASNATQEDVREDLERRLEDLKADLKTQQAQQEERVAVQEREELMAKLALTELQTRAEIDMKKSKVRTEMWQSFLVRESVATIVGGFLLITITIILLIAMFFKLATPDTINNSFLVILGYFFGQATNRVLPHAKDNGSSQGDDTAHKL
ncbi:MAG TPA: hypothetical protein VF043_02055 [Ktedonobacteraceae bacterium]